MQCLLAFHFLDIKVELLHVVASLCLVRVFFVCVDELTHKLVILLDVLFGLSFSNFDLFVQILIHFDCLDQILTCCIELRLADIADFRIWNFFRVKI
jgi:hypothetical protein